MKLYDKGKLKSALVKSLESRGVKKGLAMILVFRNEEYILNILSTQLEYMRLVNDVKHPAICSHLRLKDQKQLDDLIQGQIEFYVNKISEILKNKK